MSTKTPYELRFEMFKQSYSMLCDKYYAITETEREMNGGTLPEERKDFLPSFPCLGEVLEVADIINSFVSDVK